MSQGIAVPGTIVPSGVNIGPGGAQGVPGVNPNPTQPLILGGTTTPDSNAPSAIVVPRYVNHPDAAWSPMNAFDDHFDGASLNAKWVVTGPTAGMAVPTLTQGGSELLISGQSATADTTNYQYVIQQALPNHNPFTISCKAEVDLQVYPGATSPANVFAAAIVKLTDASGNYGVQFYLSQNYTQSGAPWYYNNQCSILFGSGFGTYATYGFGGKPVYFRFMYTAAGNTNVFASRTGRNYYLLYTLTGAQTGFATNPPAYLAFLIQNRWFSFSALQIDWVKFTNP